MSTAVQITRDSVVTQSQHQVGCEIDGEAVLMHIETGEYFGCDATASRIWKLIEEPRSVAGLCDALVQDFDVEDAQCERDVIDFLSELATESLVDVTDVLPT